MGLTFKEGIRRKLEEAIDRMSEGQENQDLQQWYTICDISSDLIVDRVIEMAREDPPLLEVRPDFYDAVAKGLGIKEGDRIRLEGPIPFVIRKAT